MWSCGKRPYDYGLIVALGIRSEERLQAMQLGPIYAVVWCDLGNTATQSAYIQARVVPRVRFESSAALYAEQPIGYSGSTPQLCTNPRRRG